MVKEVVMSVEWPKTNTVGAYITFQEDSPDIPPKSRNGWHQAGRMWLSNYFTARRSGVHSFEAFAIPRTHFVSVTAALRFLFCFFWNPKYRHVIILWKALFYPPLPSAFPFPVK